VLSLALVILAFPLASLVARAGLAGGRAAIGQAPSWSISGLVGTLARAWPDVVEPSALSFAPMSSPLAASAMLALCGSVLAAGLAWGLAWFSRSSTFWSVVTLVVASVLLAVPGPVVGLAFKMAYLPFSWVHDTPVIAGLTLAARVTPFALAILVPAVRAVPSSLLDGAAVAGLGPWGRLVQVAWPLTARAVAAATGVGFALAFGELPASNVVLPPGVTTAPLRTWMLLHTGVEGHTAGVVLILVLITASIGALTGLLTRLALSSGAFDP
jgi:iron(III) transport system permease protein